MSESPSSDPLVTVGMPVYNAERFIEQSIKTILAQTFQDFVVLISDNGSTDKTGDICRHYEKQDPRVIYHRNATNIGMPGNFNLTFAMSRSKYFRWATADDYIDHNLLEDAVEILEGDPSLALCYPKAVFVDETGEELFRWQDELHLMEDDPASRFRAAVTHIERVHHHLGLMRSECVRKTGMWGRHVSTDQGFVAEMSLYGKFYQIDRYQFYRRKHKDSSSWATKDEKHQSRTYHAAGVQLVPFDRIRYHLQFVHAVKRSPLSRRTRWALYRFLLGRAGLEKGRIVRESARSILYLITPRG